MKSLLILPIAAALVLVGGTAHAADKVDTSKLPAPAAKKGVTFDKDIKTVLDRSCGKCHGGDKPKGKYRVDTAENVKKGGDEHAPAVVVGKSADSVLIHFVADLIEDYEMPPKDKRDKYQALTKDEIGLLRAWIDQGAK
jgi:hypothetical protein